MFSGLLLPREGSVGQQDDSNQSHFGDPCLVLNADPKPRLSWTADLRERFVDAVTQLGGANRGKDLQSVDGSFYKYRLGKQSGKDFDDGCKDGISASYLLEGPGTGNSSPKLPVSDVNE